MNLEGFHFTTHRGNAGPKAPAHEVEEGSLVRSVSRYPSWDYPKPVPTSGKNQSVYWFSYEDLQHLMQVDRAEVKRLARVHSWRSRRNHTTRERQFYLYDLIATVWSYMENYFGHKLDMELLDEAKRWREGPMP